MALDFDAHAGSRRRPAPRPADARPPSRRLRVCEFTPSLSSGGAEERIARVLSSLDRDRFDLTWIGFGDVQHHLTDRAGQSVRVVPFARDPSRGVESSLILRLARTLTKIAPDVIHTHNWSTSLYGIIAARLAGIPAVIYGEGGRDSPAGPSRRRRALMRVLAPHVDRFTAVCEFLGRELELLWRVPGDRVVVIPNGVDLDRIDRGLSREEARKMLGVPDDALVVGSITGRFRAVKRLFNVVDAVGALGGAFPNVHLILVGDPLDLEHELRWRASLRKLDGRFHLTGHVPGPSSILRAFDVVVNCSSFEGASNSILEAMGARLPVVATAVGGTPEQIENGISGILVPPEDVERLGEGIARFLGDAALRRSCGERAREKIERRYTLAGMVEQYKLLYEHMRGLSHSRARLRSVADLGTSILNLVEDALP